VDKVSPIKLFDENKTIAGFNLRHLLRTPAGSDRAHKAMDKVLALWKQKVIKPIIDSSWALEDVSFLQFKALGQNVDFCFIAR
jgi:hypothetical protein